MINEVHVQDGPFVEMPNAQAYAELDRDIIKITVPRDLIDLLIKAKGHQAAHEVGHHILDEAAEDITASTGEAHILANDLIHYAANTNTYQYTKRYVNRLLMFRYGILYVSIKMFDVKALIKDADFIRAEMRAGRGRGPHEVWTK